MTVNLDVYVKIVDVEFHGSEDSTLAAGTVEANGTFEYPEVIKLWCNPSKKGWIARRSVCGVEREHVLRNAFSSRGVSAKRFVDL